MKSDGVDRRAIESLFERLGRHRHGIAPRDRRPRPPGES
jgi:hypothetical protein